MTRYSSPEGLTSEVELRSLRMERMRPSARRCCHPEPRWDESPDCDGDGSATRSTPADDASRQPAARGGPGRRPARPQATGPLTINESCGTKKAADGVDNGSVGSGLRGQGLPVAAEVALVVAARQKFVRGSEGAAVGVCKVEERRWPR